MLDTAVRQQLEKSCKRLFSLADAIEPSQRVQLSISVAQFLDTVARTMAQMHGPVAVPPKTTGPSVLSATCPKCGRIISIALQ